MGKKRDAKKQQAWRRKLYKRDGGVCAHCGLRCEPSHWEAHHRIRVIDGGDWSLENGLTLCPECHKKTHRSADDADDAGEVVAAMLVPEYSAFSIHPVDWNRIGRTGGFGG